VKSNTLKQFMTIFSGIEDIMPAINESKDLLSLNIKNTVE